jgi:hypothetical protein
MTGRRRIAFALVAIAGATATAAAGLLAVDVHLHSKYQTSAGFNVWGYRGPVVGRKQPGEYRVAMLGGSSAFGYGVTWDEAMPAQLERRLAERAHTGRSFRVVNLGYNNEGAYSFTFTLKDYEYLRYDLACLYEGYNDLSGDPNGANLSVFRHDSPVFRLTGYLPIFPIVFKEKAAAMKAGGDPGALYRDASQTVFRPNLATRAASDVLRTAGEVGQSLERQLGRVTTEPPRGIGAVDQTGCKYPWGQYCRSISDAIVLALSRHKQVLFITQPYELGAYLRMRQAEQQREAASMIARQFGGNPNVGYVNFGEAIDLSDPSLSFDRMHLTAEGNQRLAAALVEPVMQMAGRASRRN